MKISALALAAALGVLSGSAQAASVISTTTGILTKVTGPDGLNLSGKTFTVTVTADSSAVASPLTTTLNSSSGTYTTFTVSTQDTALPGVTLPCNTTRVTLTDNVTGSDSIDVTCGLTVLGNNLQISSHVIVPGGYIVAAAVAAYPAVPVTGTTSLTNPSTGDGTSYTLSGTSQATGAPAPTISPNPTSWSPTAAQGSTTPVTQSLTLSASVPESYSVGVSGGSWLTVNPTTGNTSGAGYTGPTLTLSANPAGQAAGTLIGQVLVRTGQATYTIPVSFTISQQSKSLVSNPTSLSFAWTSGSAAPASKTLTITTNPTSATNVSAVVASGNNWLQVGPVAGVTPATFTVSVNTANIGGSTSLNGSIQISAPGVSNNPLTVPVSLTITQSAIIVPTTPLTFSYVTGSTAPAAQPVSISGASGITFTSSTNQTWLLASPSSGTVPSSLSVSVNPGNLTAGTYTGIVTVAQTGTSNSAVIPVTLNIIGSGITVSTTPLTFNYLVGVSTPAAQMVSISGTSGLPFTASANQTWLGVSPSSGSTPATLTISINTAGLSVGTLTGAVTVTSPGANGSPATIPVTLNVTSNSISATPSPLTFVYPAGGTLPVPQSIALSGTSGLAFTAAVTSGNGWLSVSPTSGSVPATLTASVSPTGLAAGSYTGAITVTAPDAGNSPLTINVTLSVRSSAGIPVIVAVLDAAGYQGTSFAPGMIVSIFGVGLGPVHTDDFNNLSGEAFRLNASGSVDNTLAGVKVTVDGVPAIPLFVFGKQINAILPFSAATSGQASVMVEYDGAKSAPYSIPMAPAAMRLFSADFSGTGPGAILNQDYTVNSASNPAAKGSVIILYGTGGGAVTPAVTDGNVAGATLSRVVAPASATVNGKAAQVLYAGTAPGLVLGVYQLNLQLPADVATGSAAIVVNAGDSQTPPGLTVFVQ